MGDLCYQHVLHEQTQVAKCLWPQAAHIDTPLRHSTVAPHTRHRPNHDSEGVCTTDPWRPGGEASAASQHW